MGGVGGGRGGAPTDPRIQARRKHMRLVVHRFYSFTGGGGEKGGRVGWRVGDLLGRPIFSPRRALACRQSQRLKRSRSTWLEVT